MSALRPRGYGLIRPAVLRAGSGRQLLCDDLVKQPRIDRTEGERRGVYALLGQIRVARGIEGRASAARFLDPGRELPLIALLGASPGASTAAFIAISVLEKCFANELTAAGWLPRLKEIIPSYGVSLIEDADFLRRVRADTAAVLKVENV
jgi:Malate:quinone oxidoreductase (Mqo)